MVWEIRIDPSNGHVWCGAVEVTPATTRDQLNDDFRISEEQLVAVNRRLVPCSFATTHGRKDALDFDVSLRFESGVLVSVFIAITDPNLRTETLDEFYASREPLMQLHRDWLRAQMTDVEGGLPNATGPARISDYPWGSVGVARDKSDGIYVFVHMGGGSRVSRPRS